MSRRSIRFLPGLLLGLALVIQGCGAVPGNLVAVSKGDAATGTNQAMSRALTPIGASAGAVTSVASTPTVERPVRPIAPTTTAVTTPSAKVDTAAAPASFIPLGGGPAVGQPAPDFSLVGLDGKTVRLSDFRGQPVVVNFFATWCGPCKEELPQFQATYEKDHTQGLQVLLVDLKESPSDVRSFAGQLGLSMPIAVDQQGVVASKGYALTNIPTTYFIDGKRIAAFAGPILSIVF
jgi:peroxiredoxin